MITMITTITTITTITYLTLPPTTYHLPGYHLPDHGMIGAKNHANQRAGFLFFQTPCPFPSFHVLHSSLPPFLPSSHNES